MIIKHPVAYLQHRVAVFLAEMRVTWRPNFYLWPNITDSPERSARLKHDAAHSCVQKAWTGGLVKLAFTPLYWAWVYFVLGLIVIWLCRRDRIALTVALSGIMCELGLFIAAPAIDYRYSHWMVTCTIVAAVYHVAVRIKVRSMPVTTGASRPG